MVIIRVVEVEIGVLFPEGFTNVKESEVVVDGMVEKGEERLMCFDEFEREHFEDGEGLGGEGEFVGEDGAVRTVDAVEFDDLRLFALEDGDFHEEWNVILVRLMYEVMTNAMV